MNATSYHYSDLKSKLVLVTGATRGIGRGIALELARQQAHVVFNYRGAKNIAEDLTQEIQNLGGNASALFFDVKDFAKAQEALGNFQKEKGPISGLVNNAGISRDQLLMRLKEQDVVEILDTNLKSVILLTSFLSRSFLKVDKASVVNISSIVGLMGNASQSVYAASKAGIIGFTKSCAKEFGSRQIRFNAICPGFIETDMTKTLSDEAKEHYLANIPFKRWGTINEVANIVCFLMSDASSYVTGEVIKIDGGLYI